MLAIEFSFPAGRYHANPWGRNVNEGVVEWPPSPYRLARALVDLCRRRRPDWSDKRLADILDVLKNPPLFFLPPATEAHTRAFLSSNLKDPTKKQKVFDAFVVIERHEKLYAGFDTDADPKVYGDLTDLLQELNFLGRSESWVEARLCDPGACPGFNCEPAVQAIYSGDSETVSVACLRDPDEYIRLPKLPEKKTGKGQGGKVTLSWLEALCLSTDDLLAAGWSEPPGMRAVNYLRSADALRPAVRTYRGMPSPQFCLAGFELSSRVLPRVTDTLPLAERFRTKLMGIHRKLMKGDKARVSPIFSGKDALGNPLNGHQHVFIWPVDKDGDGRLDHLIVKCGRPFNLLELKALENLRSIWQPGGRPDIEIVLSSLSGEVKECVSKTWASATPFVTTRHYRRSLGDYHAWLEEEIGRECEYHGLPRPDSIQFLDRTQGEGHRLRWMEFVRNRKGECPLRGYGFSLGFAEPMKGPFALGALCHYGLGLFLPHRSE